MGRYNEIFRLKEMLEQAGIPFEFYDRSERGAHDWEMFQICYPNINPDTRACSVVEGRYTYGSDADLVEIMGLLTEAEERGDSVRGWLTAEDVFSRISEYHQKYVIGRRTKQP